MLEDTMKLDALNALIARLENEKTMFDMEHWLSVPSEEPGGDEYEGISSIELRGKEKTCGTAGCLAGHLFLMLPLKERDQYLKEYDAWDANPVVKAATNALDINSNTSSVLFQLHGNYELGKIRREDALKLLYGIRDGGVLDWNKSLGLEDGHVHAPIKITLI